jgi:hypothetical protein
MKRARVIGTAAKALVVLATALFAVVPLSGCGAGQPVPRAVWLLQEGDPKLRVKSLDARQLGANLELVWTLGPGQGRALPSQSRDVTLTFIMPAGRNPNWKPFEVREGGSLVNHIVRPEEDYLKTGGSLGPQAIGAVRDRIGATGPVHLVTIRYPLDLGIVREPGDVTIRHVLGPQRMTVLTSYFRAGYSIEEDAASGAGPGIPEIRLDRGVALDASGVSAPGDYVFVVQRPLRLFALATVVIIVLAMLFIRRR